MTPLLKGSSMLKKNNDETIHSHHEVDINRPLTLLEDGLRQLVEQAHERSLQDIAEQTMPVLYQMGQIETKQQQALYNLETIQKQFEVFLANNKLLENASLENQVLTRQHYEEHVILPMVRSIFPVFDIIHDAKLYWKGPGKPDAPQIMNLIDAIWIQLQQFLRNYDIEIVAHKPKAIFEPQLMRPVKARETDDKDLDGLVAKSLQVGFRQGRQRLLRLETISLYTYRPSHTETVTLNEREKNENTRN
jgi:molecular chaperone GrpE (heat shock protein)